MEIIGKGTLQEVRPGKEYRIRHNLGKDPVTKTYKKSPWKTVYCTKRQARDELARYKNELIRQAELESNPRLRPAPTIHEYSEEYMDIREALGQVAPTTLATDRYTLKHLDKLFGHVLMNDLTTNAINKRLAAYRKEGASLNCIRNIQKMLKRIYRQAMLEGIIDYRNNPCNAMKVVKRSDPDRNSLSPEDAARLYSIVVSLIDQESFVDSHHIAVFIGMITGMRKGEVLGLTWKNVDLDGRKIDVVQQITEKEGIKPPKSRAGIRRLSVDEEAARLLGTWKAKQSVQLKAVGKKQSEGSFVAASNETGGPIDGHDFTRWFHAFCVNNEFGHFEDEEGNVIVRRFNEAGFPVDENDRPYSRSNPKPKIKVHYKGLKFHEFRHTQASLLIASGADIKTVQYRLGHSEVSTTLDIYSHVINANDESAASMFGQILSTGKLSKETREAS